jgi:urease accessory protein
MERDARRMRGAGPFVFAQATKGAGVDEVCRRVLAAAGLSKTKKRAARSR